jgi:hypothetical protein
MSPCRSFVAHRFGRRGFLPLFDKIVRRRYLSIVYVFQVFEPFRVSLFARGLNTILWDEDVVSNSAAEATKRGYRYCPLFYLKPNDVNRTP